MPLYDLEEMMVKLTLILAALLFGAVLPANAATKCEQVIVNDKPVRVCDRALLKGADCWRIGPIQHCDYRPDPWCRGWGCRGRW